MGRGADALISAKVSGDTTYVDLKDLRQLIPNASTSCGSAAMLAARHHGPAGRRDAAGPVRVRRRAEAVLGMAAELLRYAQRQLRPNPVQELMGAGKHLAGVDPRSEQVSTSSTNRICESFRPSQRPSR